MRNDRRWPNAHTSLSAHPCSHPHADGAIISPVAVQLLYFDLLTGKWMRARYAAIREEIARRTESMGLPAWPTYGDRGHWGAYNARCNV
jgi:hypothetical protein